VAALVSVVSGVGLVAVAEPAAAQTVESGTLVFSGDPGDWITLGRDYKYATSGGDQFSVFGTADNSAVSISVNGADGAWWSVDVEAPNGQQLTVGATYTATRYPFNGAGAGFDLSGDGRGCNELTAFVTITEASFGDNGYVERFGASFEQHCENGDSAARGEVHITNPEPPAALTVTPSVATEGTVSPVSGRARVNGTVTCNRPVTIGLSGDLSQVVRGRIVRGPLSASVACTPGAPVAWTTIVTPSGDRPFVKGRAEAYVNATARDEVYNRDVTTSITSVTTLRESTPALTDF
jgi:hypothetical protein